MRHEQKMWETLVGAVHPEWDMRLGRNSEIGSGALAMECNVYAVDVATGWMTVGTLAQAQMRALEAQVRKDAGFAAQVVDACVACIRDAAELRLSGHGDEAERCIGAAAAALCQTQTWKLALEAHQGSCAGHWIYLVYHLRAGAPLGRPLFLGANGGGLLAPRMLNAIIGQTVALDLSKPSSSVGRMIVEAGGMTVGPEFRAGP